MPATRATHPSAPALPVDIAPPRARSALADAPLPAVTRPFLPHQIEALTSVLGTMGDGNGIKAILDAACRSGKTQIAYGAHAALARADADYPGTTYGAPNMGLLPQTLREWQDLSTAPLRVLLVYSASEAETFKATGLEGIPRTTDPDVVQRFWMDPSDPRPPILLHTYQSLQALEPALQAKAAGLKVLDEAHLLCGAAEKAWLRATDHTALPAHRQLAMTGTPIFRTINRGATVDTTDMRDTHAFGEILDYRISFLAMQQAGRVTPWELHVLGVDDTEVADLLDEGEDPGIAAEAAGLVRMYQEGLTTHCFSFHSTIHDAKSFARYFARTATRAGLDIGTMTMTSADNIGTRASTIAALQARGPSLVTSINTLGVGITVPDVDTTFFSATGSDQATIVQRAARGWNPDPSNPRKRGKVVCPVPVRPGEDPDAILATSDFARVREVLLALADADAGFAKIVGGWLAADAASAYRAAETVETAERPDDSMGGRLVFHFPGGTDAFLDRARHAIAARLAATVDTRGTVELVTEAVVARGDGRRHQPRPTPKKPPGHGRREQTGASDRQNPRALGHPHARRATRAPRGLRRHVGRTRDARTEHRRTRHRSRRGVARGNGRRHQPRPTPQKPPGRGCRKQFGAADRQNPRALGHPHARRATRAPRGLRRHVGRT